jgi:quaternary ammonium compound-resistance protein SugE
MVAWITLWVVLIIAGLLEIAWAIGLKYSGGFSRPVPAIVYACMVVSVGLLGVAMRGIPAGTVYAVWTGIGTVGTAALGIPLFCESSDPLRLFFLGVIVIGVVGLGCVEFVSEGNIRR